MQRKTIYPQEVDCNMSKLAENVPVQGSILKNKRRRRILIFCGVSLVNVALLAFLLTQLLTPASHPPSDLLIGHPAPDFSLAMLSPQTGKSHLSLTSFKGRPIVLNFWASWCEPCKEEAPLLQSTWKRLHAQGKNIIFLGIDFQESAHDGSGFLNQYSITYPAGLDTDGSIASKYHVTSLPQTIFINRNGTVMGRVAQQLTDHALSTNLQLIL